MSHLQTNAGVISRNGLERTGADIAEIDESGATLQRSAVYRGLRQRDAWLRKPWGRYRTIEFTESTWR